MKLLKTYISFSRSSSEKKLGKLEKELKNVQKQKTLLSQQFIAQSQQFVNGKSEFCNIAMTLSKRCCLNDI